LFFEKSGPKCSETNRGYLYTSGNIGRLERGSNLVLGTFISLES